MYSARTVQPEQGMTMAQKYLVTLRIVQNDGTVYHSSFVTDDIIELLRSNHRFGAKAVMLDHMAITDEQAARLEVPL